MDTGVGVEVRGRAVLVKADGTRIELPVETVEVIDPNEED